MIKTPRDILLAEFGHLLGPQETAAMDEAVEAADLLPPVKRLGDLRTADPATDETDIIKSRFLYRGGVCLMVGPTGVGKSSWLMQFALHMAAREAFFGLVPGAGVPADGARVLLVQAENDEFDLAEMRDGVLHGCQDVLGNRIDRALSQIVVCTCNDRAGDRFLRTFDGLLGEHGPFDLAVVDPAFSYLGGDASAQKDVSPFMRIGLNPILTRHAVTLTMAHHTNKPLRGKEKDSWQAGDFAYLGAGSAEWINPARAALAIRSLGSDTVFELRAPKRGRKLGWTDEHGQPTTCRYIAHHREPGIICWRDADPGEVNEVLARKGPSPKQEAAFAAVLQVVAETPGRSQREYCAAVAKKIGCGHNTVQRAIAQAVEEDYIDPEQKGRSTTYKLTDLGREKA